MITVIGHKIPDTDATVSSLVFSEYLNLIGKPAKAGALGKGNNEAKFVLEYWGAKTPEVIGDLPDGAEIALVDHNEAKQSHDQLANCTIKYIVDHHKFNLQTQAPLHIYAYPFGCTATILFKLFKEAELEISKQSAGLMLSAIISDTLLFRSPTTTEADRIAAQQLAPVAGISDLATYANQMFTAKGDLTGKTPRDILLSDFKQFELAGKNVGVGVFETTDPKGALDILNELNSEMKEVAKEMNLDHFIFAIVDILESNSYMIGEKTDTEDVIAKTYGTEKTEAGYYLLPGVVSRKKQIIPPLETNL